MKFLRRWLSLQIDLGSFERRDAVYGFAMKMAFRAVLLSFLIHFVLLVACSAADLLPLTFQHALIASVALSWLTGGAVTAVLSLVTGNAIRELSLSRARFERLSRTDMLSGLLNRRAFSEVLATCGGEVSLAIFDLDRFKSINDRYGHLAGDAVIRAVAAVIRQVFADPHVAARLGGEEFGVIVRGPSAADRLALVERARLQIADRLLQHDGARISTTISAGVADFDGRRGEIVYSAADRALYLAKAAGRNRVVHETDMCLPFEQLNEAVAMPRVESA